MSMRERGGKYDSSAPLVPLIQGGSVYHCISILKIARYRTFLASSCFSVGSIRHYFPSPGRQLADRAGARHGRLTPPRISPSCPHCVICGWTGVPLYPFPVMAAPGATRFLQAAVTRSYGTGLYARPIMIIRWDLLIMSVYHGAAPESALALRAGKGGCY